jgi:hypothetical protein
MRFTRCSLFVLLTISVLCFFSSAQQTPSVASSTVVPRLVNFSGKALDERGNPISGTTAPTFAIDKDQLRRRSAVVGNAERQCGQERPLHRAVGFQ